MKIKVPAKINLMLRVTGEKSNGYHLLQMVNARTYNVFDEIEIKESDSNTIHYSKENLNNLPKDVTIELLKDIYSKYNIKKFYSIEVEKHIPEGAGLGGSSVDAAAILKYILQDNNIEYTKKDIYDICSKYGADIPYCLNEDICICEGIGEEVYNLNKLFEEPHLVIVPNIYSSTKEVYKIASNNTEKLDHKTIIKHINNNEYNKLLYNDLFNAASSINSDLLNIYNELKSYGDIIMSGSGSSFIILNFDENILKFKEKHQNFLYF